MVLLSMSAAMAVAGFVPWKVTTVVQILCRRRFAPAWQITMREARWIPWSRLELDEILRKPAKLDAAEFDKVKLHTIRGASLLEPLEILEPAVPIILYHHERYDGTGYPKGLKKEAIPLGARILAVANAFEAMVCERPYRKAVPVQEAVKEISSHAGTQFDPKVVEAFLAVSRAGRLEKVVAAQGEADRATR